jgi:hypothetical protein
MPSGGSTDQRDPMVGCCSICSHASTLVGAKGITFWRCGHSDSNAAFRRYPTLPVEDCAGFERGAPKSGTLPAD